MIRYLFSFGLLDDIFMSFIASPTYHLARTYVESTLGRVRRLERIFIISYKTVFEAQKPTKAQSLFHDEDRGRPVLL